MKQALRTILRWLSRATGVGYEPLPPLEREPIKQGERRAMHETTRRARQFTLQLRRLEATIERRYLGDKR